MSVDWVQRCAHTSRCAALLAVQAQPLQDQQGDFVCRKRTKPDEKCSAFRPLLWTMYPVFGHRNMNGRIGRPAVSPTEATLRLAADKPHLRSTFSERPL